MLAWIQNNEDEARLAFEQSAAPVIEVLRRLEGRLERVHYGLRNSPAAAAVALTDGLVGPTLRP